MQDAYEAAAVGSGFGAGVAGRKLGCDIHGKLNASHARDSPFSKRVDISSHPFTR